MEIETEDSEWTILPLTKVIEDREREQAALRALRLLDEQSSKGSDSNGMAWRCRSPFQGPPADTLLPRLIAALPARHTGLLEQYLFLLQEHQHLVSNLTDQLMERAEDALLTGQQLVLIDGEDEEDGEKDEESGIDCLVLCGWLALASVWRAPHVPRAPLMLRHAGSTLQPHEAEELARALLVTMPEAVELYHLSDVCYGAGGALPPLLLRAAISKVCEVDPDEVPWSSGAMSSTEAATALCAKWPRFNVATCLLAAKLFGRVLAEAAREERVLRGTTGASGTRGTRKVPRVRRGRGVRGEPVPGTSAGQQTRGKMTPRKPDPVDMLLDAHNRAACPGQLQNLPFVKVTNALMKLKYSFLQDEPQPKK